MADSDTDRLDAIQTELATILEERMAQLMADVKRSQEVTRQITATELEIERTRAVRAQLEAQLGERQGALASLKSEVEALEEKVTARRRQEQA